MAKKPKRPAAFRVGKTCGLSVVRGPDPADPTRWYWRCRRKGDPSTYWSGWGTAAEAEAAVVQLLAGGGRRGAEPEAETIDTVKDLLEVWLGDSQLERSDIGANRKRGLRSNCRLISRLIGPVVLERVDAGTLERLRNAMAAAGYAPGTQKIVIESFLGAWRWGQDRGYCDPRRLTMPRIERRALPRAQPTWEDFWWAVEASRHPTQPRAKAGLPTPALHQLPAWVTMILEIIGLSGARIGEVAALDKADLRLQGSDAGIWFGRHPEASKTGERYTLIPPDLVERIEAWLESGQAGPGPRLYPVTFSSARAGVQRAMLELPWGPGKRFTARDVRNLVVDTYYDEQRDPSVEARQLGHSPQQALESYRRVRDHHVRAQIATLRGWLPPGAGGTQVSDIEVARRRREGDG